MRIWFPNAWARFSHSLLYSSEQRSVYHTYTHTNRWMGFRESEQVNDEAASLHYAFWLLFQSKLFNSTYKWRSYSSYSFSRFFDSIAAQPLSFSCPSVTMLIAICQALAIKFETQFIFSKLLRYFFCKKVSYAIIWNRCLLRKQME